jgi:hypothetical protein
MIAYTMGFLFCEIPMSQVVRLIREAEIAAALCLGIALRWPGIPSVKRLHVEVPQDSGRIVG